MSECLRVVVTMADQTSYQIVAGGTGDQVFASGVNIENPNNVGVVEAGAKVVKKR